jgi:hypothetical protein
LTRQTARGLLIAAISGGLIWVVWIYGNGLRDPRYLDGWVLAGGMSFQLFFHIAIKTASLSPKSAIALAEDPYFCRLSADRRLHLAFGFLSAGHRLRMGAVGGFVLVTLSGILGTYLAWSLQAKHGIDERVSYDRIPTAAPSWRAMSTPPSPRPIRPPLRSPCRRRPYDAWIMDLYTTHLRDFFQGQRNFTAHLIGSQRPLKRLTDEIDNLSRYVDQRGQEKLAAIRNLVVEKDRLDSRGSISGSPRAGCSCTCPSPMR